MRSDANVPLHYDGQIDLELLAHPFVVVILNIPHMREDCVNVIKSFLYSCRYLIFEVVPSIFQDQQRIRIEFKSFKKKQIDSFIGVHVQFLSLSTYYIVLYVCEISV